MLRRQLLDKWDAFWDPGLVESLRSLKLFVPEYHFTKDTIGGRATVFDRFVRMTRSDYRKPDPQSLFLKPINTLSEFFFRSAVDIDVLEAVVPLNSVDDIASTRETNLHRFSTLSDFGRYNYRYYRENEKFKFFSEKEYFRKCLDDALHRDPLHVNYSVNLWDPVITWSNIDVSHRYATAHYINRREGYGELLTCNLSVYRFDFNWLERFQDVFDAYFLGIKSEDRYAEGAFYSNRFFSQGYQHPAFLEIWRGEDGRRILLLLNNFPRSVNPIVKRWLERSVEKKLVVSLFKVINDLKLMERRGEEDLQRKLEV